MTSSFSLCFSVRRARSRSLAGTFFYRHFPSKDALLLAMFRRDSERVTSQLAGLVAAAPDASAALEEWVGFQLALCYDPRRFRRVQVMMSDEVRRSPGYAQAQHDVA